MLGKERSLQAVEPAEGSLLEAMAAHKLAMLLPHLSALRIYSKDALRARAQGRASQPEDAGTSAADFRVLSWVPHVSSKRRQEPKP